MGIAGGSHDGQVIAASLRDPDRFTEIFERHFDAIYAFAARRLGREVADDVGANVFVEAFAARTRFELDRVDARPWLYGGVDLTGPGCRTLDGSAALSWVRSRHLEIEQNGTWVEPSPRADLDRQARQQDFMRSLARTAEAKVGDDPVAAVRLVDALIPALTIDVHFGKQEILGLVRALVGIDPGTAQLSTLPIQAAPDGATFMLREPDAETALAPFTGGAVPTDPPPPGLLSDHPVTPSPGC